MSDDATSPALQEKELGTAAYKKKNYPEALEHYNKAAELDPTDMVYLLNIGAVHLQTKSYDECIAACHKAIEVGEANHATFQMLAKGYARLARAYQAQEKYAEAIRFVDKALANDRTQAFLKQKKEIEKLLKEKLRLEYINPEKAVEAKTEGNEHFKAGRYPEAVERYTEAIKRNPDDAKLYSNRAAAYTKLATFNLALDDCNECISRDPSFIKGYLRKGTILLALKQPSEAEKVFQEALKLDPNHAEAQGGLQKCQQQRAGFGLSREERAQQAMQDPEIQAILGDPVMQQILSQMQDNPQALGEHMKDPKIAEKIQKLAECGILGFK